MQAAHHNGLHSQMLDSTTSPVGLPATRNLRRHSPACAVMHEPYGDWAVVRRHARSALIRQRLVLTPQQLRDAVERAVLLAKQIAGDPGTCERVTIEHLAAAVLRLVDELGDPWIRALHSLLDAAALEIAAS